MIDCVVGIIGWPVSHSLSPIMHHQAFVHTGLANWCYIPMPVSPERLQEAVLGLRALGFKGANVTVPYKEAVMPYLDHISDEARVIGAVNTIALDKAGKLLGYNTDSQGFIDDVLEHKIALKNSRVLVLGAGGSARAIVYGLLNHGCKHITILNRTENAAADIANSFRDLCRDREIKTGSLTKHYFKDAHDADMVINTTSLGMEKTKEDMPWDETIPFAAHQLVYDVIYNPSVTTLLKHAQKSGAKTLNGLGMLVHQGALAFSIWTGHKAPIEVMRKALI